MGTYEGSAVVTADGAEFPVAVYLTLTPGPGLREWYGTLIAPGEEATWRMHEADETTIRIGPAASFITTLAQLGGTELGIQGSGTPPFEG
ncbi:DUF4873 domain-containing protein [Streptomyces vinaceus]|uniref:DUF4873 domain-containing protein n=1 Tax=Streptomyces vinaceus TaxID=1960 RepID=UPI0037F250A2